MFIKFLEGKNLLILVGYEFMIYFLQMYILYKERQLFFMFFYFCGQGWEEGCFLMKIVLVYLVCMLKYFYSYEILFENCFKLYIYICNIKVEVIFLKFNFYFNIIYLLRKVKGLSVNLFCLILYDELMFLFIQFIKNLICLLFLM